MYVYTLHDDVISIYHNLPIGGLAEYNVGINLSKGVRLQMQTHIGKHH
jgi:hypothetical protein